MRVRVYKNLHRSCLSVQVWSESKNGWRVDKSRYCQSIVLTDVEFQVGEAGNGRVRAGEPKNVHAFVIGTTDAPVPSGTISAVTYNPRKGHKSFVRVADESRIDTALAVEVNAHGPSYATE
jgi:hypothetical protein